MQRVSFIALLMFSLMLCGSSPLQAQSNIWRTLGMVTFIPETGADERSASIVEMIEKMEGTEVTVKGYMIPLSGKRAMSHFMYSAFPYNMCFFCGKAGPESVMEVYMKDDKKLDYSDDAIYLKGKFRWFSRDKNDIMFILEEAVQVKG